MYKAKMNRFLTFNYTRLLTSTNSNTTCIASTHTHSITNNGNTTNTANAGSCIANGNTTAARSLCTIPLPTQSKEPSLMSKLQAPDKEATVRLTVDMSEFVHRKLSMLAGKTGRKKVDRLCGCCSRMDWRRWTGKSNRSRPHRGSEEVL